MGDFGVWGRSPLEIQAAVTSAESGVWHWALLSLSARIIRQSGLLFLLSHPSFHKENGEGKDGVGQQRESPPQGVNSMAVHVCLTEFYLGL